MDSYTEKGKDLGHFQCQSAYEVCKPTLGWWTNCPHPKSALHN